MSRMEKRVLTFGNEYAKMQSTHLGFIVPVLFLLICLPSGLMSIVVDTTLSGVIIILRNAGRF